MANKSLEILFRSEQPIGVPMTRLGKDQHLFGIIMDTQTAAQLLIGGQGNPFHFGCSFLHSVDHEIVVSCGYALPPQKGTTLHHLGTGQHNRLPGSTRVSGLLRGCLTITATGLPLGPANRRQLSGYTMRCDAACLVSTPSDSAGAYSVTQYSVA